MFWKNHNSENAVSHTPRPQKVARLVLAAAASVAIAAPVSFISTRTARAADPVEINRDNQRMSAADQKKMEEGFFKRAASGNSLEIRLAKLAEERATDPQVKQLAMTIQHDHEDANRILANITKQNQLDVSVDYLTPVAEATYKALDDLQGNEFNRTYVFQQTGAHLQDELTYAWETNHGESDACRSYATQVLPKIQSHLRSLEQIARPMAGLPENPAAQLMPEQR